MFWRTQSGVPDVSERDFAACHRWNQRSDAGSSRGSPTSSKETDGYSAPVALKTLICEWASAPTCRLSSDRWRKSFSRNGEHYPLKWNQRPIYVTCGSGPTSNCLWAKTMTPFYPALSHIPSSKASWELPRCLPPWNREPPWWHKPWCKYLYS